jgi:hypothetical protein
VSRPILALLCFGLVCGILAACLYPFRAGPNRVVWLDGKPGLRFSKTGVVWSSRLYERAVFPEADSVTLQALLLPAEPRQEHTILAFYRPGAQVYLSLTQFRSALVVRLLNQGRHHRRVAQVDVDTVFRPRQPALVTLTLKRGETRVYVDGVLRRTVRDFPLSARHMTGQLVVGTDPFGDDSWAGEIRYLALLNRSVSQQEAQQAAVANRRRGEFAVYLFDEGSGPRARNVLGGGPDLIAPEQYTVPQKTLLEIPRKWHWDDLFLNIGGFVPFGVCFYALFSSIARLARAAPVITVLSGTLLSLTVEILQVVVPERDSDAADVVTNTLGAVLGVILFRRLAPRLNELLNSYRGALDSRRAT